jgi:hypothetical protein
MTPGQFIDKWTRAARTERQAAQEHFIDLCRMLGEPTPNEAADPDAYSFEKGVSKIDGSAGFADVWKRGYFGWEYKKDRANLDLAYQQLQLYSVALENPPRRREDRIIRHDRDDALRRQRSADKGVEIARAALPAAAIEEHEDRRLDRVGGL